MSLRSMPFSRRRSIARTVEDGALYFGQLLTACTFCLLIGISAGLTPSAVAAQPLPPADSMDWTNFADFDGPAVDDIFSLYANGDGYLWVSTSVGVSVRAPDGRWLSLSMDDGLAGNRVAAVATDPLNPRQHWFATNGGATLLDDGGDLFDSSKHQWMTFGKRDGILDHRLSSVTIAPNGEIWFGLSYFDTDLDVRIGNGISLLDPHGTPFDKSDDTWRSFTAANSHLSTDVIHKLYADDAGIIWIATQSGLNAYQDGQWMLFSMEQGLPANDITNVQIVGQQLWLGTSDGYGLLDYAGTLTTPADDRWQTYPISPTLSTNVSAVGIDANGYLWSGLYHLFGDDGSSRVMVRDLKGTPFNVDDDDLLALDTSIIDDPRALAVAGDDIWFAADGGIHHVSYTGSPLAEKQLQWRNETAGNGLFGSTVSTVAPFAGDGLLVAVDGQPLVLQYGYTPHDLRDDRWFYAGVSSGSVIATDHKNRFWMGSGTSLVVLDPGRLENEYDDEGRQYDDLGGLKLAQINAIVIDEADRAWIANGDYFGGGLTVLSAGDSAQAVSDDQMTTFTTQNSGLPGLFVTTVALGADRDTWVGTTTGAAHLRYGPSPFSKQDDQWTIFTTQNSGIAANHIRGIAVDVTGNAWFALATGGVSVYTTSGDWVTFTESDGLIFNAVNAVAVDLEGNLWFGTDGEGISVLNTAGTIGDKSDDQWVTFPADGPLLSGYIRALTVDYSGQVWVGTFGGGLSVYSTVEFQHSYLPIIREVYR